MALIQKWLAEVFRVDGGGEQQDSMRQLQLACAVLLVDIARSDWEEDERERRVMLAALEQNFALSAEDAQRLLAEAEAVHDKEVSLHGFLRTINEHWGQDERRRLLRQLWQVAFADGDLAAYEEHTIRRLAELLYLPQQDFIREKLGQVPADDG